MNKLIVSALIAFASAGAFAQEATVFADQQASALSRAEVRTEVLAAMARGEALGYGEASVNAVEPVAAMSRAQVKAEVVSAIARGEHVLYGEAQI